MEVMTILLLGAVGVLAVIFIGKYLRARAELRSFREQIREIRTTDREQPIKVASFSAPSVELAVEINRLVEELKCIAARSAEEEKRLRTIMAGVSHDFRTPLTAASGYLQLVEEMVGKLLSTQGSGAGEERQNRGTGEERQNAEHSKIIRETDEQQNSLEAVNSTETVKVLLEIRDYLQIVSERVHYLNALSDEFFEVTYLDAKNDIPLEEVRFDRLLSEVILGQYRWIEDGQIETRFRIPEEQMLISADRHYLERILENLFSNARKYTKSFLSVEVQKSEDHHIEFIMRNDIRENMEIDPAHIFEPFYRAKGRSGQGTGLGLYVCRELAEAMHFTIAGEVKDGVFELKLVM